MIIRTHKYWNTILPKIYSVILVFCPLLISSLFINLFNKNDALAEAEVPFSQFQTKQIFNLIEKYISDNPEIVLKALEKIQDQEKESIAKEQKKQVNQNRDILFSGPEDMILGNPKGTISIVEFFDYQCGYCKKMLRVLLRATEDHPDLKVILKEYPILGPVSVTAAQASLASRRQGKYKNFHQSLMLMNGRLSERAIFKIAGEVGLNIDKLKADMADPEIFSLLNTTRELGQKLSIRGTPALVVNNEIIPGAINLKKLRNLILEKN